LLFSKEVDKISELKANDIITKKQMQDVLKQLEDGFLEGEMSREYCDIKYNIKKHSKISLILFVIFCLCLFFMYMYHGDDTYVDYYSSFCFYSFLSFLGFIFPSLNLIYAIKEKNEFKSILYLKIKKGFIDYNL
jgi:hypothetical protein